MRRLLVRRVEAQLVELPAHLREFLARLGVARARVAQLGLELAMRASCSTARHRLRCASSVPISMRSSFARYATRSRSISLAMKR